MIQKKNLRMLILFIALCLCVELLASWFTFQGVREWYPAIQKPVWTPPGGVFGPVWTALYLMMAFALWHVWKTFPSKPKTSAYFGFGVQLLLNMLWSLFFFTLRSPFLALLDIGLLWISVVCTVVAFYRIRPLGGYLLVPYFLWVSFAAVLNFKIWLLNR
jgi:benzodiazapine receptor